MPRSNSVDPGLLRDLTAIYEEVIWLARRPTVTPSLARAWYTHVMAGTVARRIRRFSGKVSTTAASSDSATLRLEHYRRIQTSLTSLVARHLGLKSLQPEEFIRLVLTYECVHIVTFEENYAAMRAKGDYRKAGIVLVPWRAIPHDRQVVLWRKMLRGKVANAAAYSPH